MRERDNIRAGMLTLGLHQQAFIDVWGNPTRTATASSDEDVIRAGINGYGGGFFSKGKDTYEVWEYADKHTLLCFSDRELISWKTAETVHELSTPRS